MPSLADKVGIVTGGGSGIGRATALAMARAGATLVIGNRNSKQGEETVAAIRRGGGRAVFQSTDVTKPAEVQALVARAMQEFGRLDLAFNNAGTDGEQVPLHEQDIDKASFLFDVNIKGVFLCMKFEIDQMLKTGGGAIVNTSSIFGLNGYPGWSLYSATKHAVTGMTKSAALDYAKRNVRVNAVGPGPVETPLLAKGTGGDPHSYASFVPMGRIGQPDEIADAVVWLLSDESRFVTGHTLPVDGGVSSQSRERRLQAVGRLASSIGCWFFAQTHRYEKCQSCPRPLSPQITGFDVAVRTGRRHLTAVSTNVPQMERSQK